MWPFADPTEMFWAGQVTASTCTLWAAIDRAALMSHAPAHTRGSLRWQWDAWKKPTKGKTDQREDRKGMEESKIKKVERGRGEARGETRQVRDEGWNERWGEICKRHTLCAHDSGIYISAVDRALIFLPLGVYNDKVKVTGGTWNTIILPFPLHSSGPTFTCSFTSGALPLLFLSSSSPLPL